MAKRNPKKAPSTPDEATPKADPDPTGSESAKPDPTAPSGDPSGSSTTRATTPSPGEGTRPGEPVDPATQQVKLEKSDPKQKEFLPENLDRTIIAIPLLKILKAEDDPKTAPSATGLAESTTTGANLHPVIIDLNLLYSPDGRKGARKRVLALIDQVVPASAPGAPNKEGVNVAKSALSLQYLFCKLSGESIRELVVQDSKPTPDEGSKAHHNAIHRIWPDFRVKGMISKSISTVKADAAHRSFSALGDQVVWAVIDSGIDENHPHFQGHKNLDLDPLDPAIQHQDYTVIGNDPIAPLKDVYGHGSHVGGIIAGGIEASEKAPIPFTWRRRNEKGDVERVPDSIKKPITGMAPQCRLLSLKVLDDNGDGEVSSIIAALEYIQEVNGHGRRIRVHGVNLSVGYDYQPEWFACGQSPLCVEVNRLVKSGVVVVAAAGNSGYGQIIPEFASKVNSAGIELTINDPGNAELAITVGSTHRDMPHIYGVSYFSSKGPTGDGRYKPDLVAPGEKIISCWSSGDPKRPADQIYKEDSGTSMAAPHVSGVIAAFLSARPEYIGQPEEVKRIFLATATDLNRTPYFQGKGLVDLMRAIQSV